MSEESENEQRKRYGRRPGEDWRVAARKDGEVLEWGLQGVFDEICVDHWLHVEQLDERLWVMQVGDARISVDINEAGQVTVNVERGFYSEVRGSTSDFKRQ
jgi:hypothetical protein